MPAAPRPIRHIVLVIFDTLRRDAVSCYGSPPEWASISTPHLDAFAREEPDHVVREDELDSLRTQPPREALEQELRAVDELLVSHRHR